jgi:ABC-type glycerol-3-phosphate transport system substrate-binding protein
VSKADLVNVHASLYMSVSQSAPTIQFAALPALDRPTAPIGRGWAFALVTRDVRRQAAALKLLQWLLAPSRAGDLSRAARRLPGRAAALTIWDQAEPYTGFIRDQLTLARAAPPASVADVVGPVLRQAIDDVLTGRATPDEAALTAVTALGAKRP